MRPLAFALILVLAACGDISTYQPYVQDINDPAALAKDEGDCLKHAQVYSVQFDFEGIGTAGLKGMAENAPGGAVDPLVPALGGIGGATSALLDSLGVLSDKQRRVFLICLHDRGERSRAYDVMDPNQ